MIDPSVVETYSAPSGDISFRTRLRFRVQKKLNIETAEHSFRVGNVEAVLSSFDKDRPIKDSYWLVINARGFATADDARATETACVLPSSLLRLRRVLESILALMP